MPADHTIDAEILFHALSPVDCELSVPRLVSKQMKGLLGNRPGVPVGDEVTGLPVDHRTSKPTTGTPHAIASNTTIGKPSLSLNCHKRLA